MGELSVDTVEEWIKCDCANRGVTRLEAIENYLKLSEALGEAEEKLLVEWLESTDGQLKYSYDGCLSPYDWTVDQDADNRITGFSWSLDEYGGAECDESYGTFSVKVFNWTFCHYGVSYFNEDSWYDEEWFGDGESTELSAALNRRMDVAHVEDYIDSIVWRESNIDAALDQMRDRAGRDVAELLFYRDDRYAVYVFEGIEDEEAARSWDKPRTVIPSEKVPDDLVRIDRKMAVEILAKLKLPFVHNV